MNKKIYFPNLVNHEFILAQPNIHWYADFTEIKVLKDQKIHLFFLIDGCFNEIIKFSVSTKTITTADTIRRIESTLKQRRIVEEEAPQLIIHTDRGTQFSSDNYLQFTNKFKKRFRPSMSPMASPTHNAVIERFIGTFKRITISDKEFGIENENLEEFLKRNFQKEKFKNLRNILEKYIDFYNQNKKTKKAPLGAIKNHEIFEEGKDFVNDPKFTQSYSSHSMKTDIRRTEIERYKSEVNLVRNLINESLLEDTTFNEAKPILIAKLKTIEKIVTENTIGIQNLQEGQTVIQEGQKLTMTAVGMLGKELGAAIEDLKQDIKELKYKPITRQLRKKLALRDAIYENHYELFMLGAGDNMNNKFKFLKTAQLRIIYTLLFFLGLRINEIKMIKKTDLILAIQTGEINIVHDKTSTCQKHVLAEAGKKKLNELSPEIDLVFDQYEFEFLGGSKPFSSKTYTQNTFIRFINEDMTETCKRYNILENFTSHSFRVGFITKLLKTVPVQKVSAIIGHQNIESTMSYQRYVINKEEIQEILKKSFE